MLREEANMVKECLKKEGCLTAELEEVINNNVEEDDLVKHDMYQLQGRDELKQLIGYSIVSVLDTTNERNREGALIRFGKLLEDDCSYIDILLSGDGNIYISDAY